MEFAVAIGYGGFALLAIAALAIGVLIQLVGDARFGYEWVATAVGAAIGAVVASEFITAWRAFEPVWDGVALAPALLGGVLVGGIVAVVTRYTTGGTYGRRPMAA